MPIFYLRRKLFMICGYLRVSTQKQAEMGCSIDMQKEIILKHARMLEIINDEQEIHFYIDDGYSAKSLERPAMRNMLKDIKNGNIEIIFVYDQSRLSREMWDIKRLLELFEKYHVILKCLYDDVSIKTAVDRYRTFMNSIHNQYERERICERTNDALKSIAESGRYPNGGHVFYGYKRGNDKNIYVDEEEAVIVQTIFNMAEQHIPLLDIAEKVNNLQNKRFFHTYQLMDILKDKRYTGLFTYKEKTYDNIIPAIITSKQQQEVLEYYTKKKYKHEFDFIFDGLVFCEHCGKKLTCATATSKGVLYFYYHCKQCHCYMSQKTLLTYFKEKKIKTSDKKKRIAEIRKAKYLLSRKLKRLKEKYINDKIDMIDYITGARPLEERLQDLNAEHNALKGQYVSTDLLEMHSNKELKNYFATNIKRIYINPVAKRVEKVEFFNDEN
ncbi:hypothetical protein B7939_01945 [Eggerthia catenaformis]|nr:hypothetical protein B7939_01945 [Eggerthia catenaformis]